MGKHEAPEQDRFDPEIHEKHRLIRSIIKWMWDTIREVLIGGSSIVLFEWLRVAASVMPVSHKTEAFVEVIRNVVS
jgi:hypothetical protein